MEIVQECRRVSRQKVCLTDDEKKELKKRYDVDVDNAKNVTQNLLKIEDQILAWKFLNTLMEEKKFIRYSSMSNYRSVWAKHYDRQFLKRPDRESTFKIRRNVFEEVLAELKTLNKHVEHISLGIDLIYEQTR